MRVLISAVGDTDPFRNFHDGALIHIARKYRPEKVILIFSEHTAKKQGNIEKALFSIAPDYEPELIIHDSIISDNEVHIFDVMFQRFSDILQEYYTTEDEFILNLSSATPQIKSALFVINRLSGINVLNTLQTRTSVMIMMKTLMNSSKSMKIIKSILLTERLKIMLRNLIRLS